MFRLQRFLSIANLMAIVTATTALTLTHYVLEVNEHRSAGERQNQAFFNQLDEALSSLYIPLLRNSGSTTSDKPILTELLAQLKLALDLQTRNTPIVNVVIYDRQGNKLFATLDMSTNTHLESNELIQSALRGIAVSKHVSKDWFSTTGQAINYVLESYFPIRDKQTDEINGVIELYSDITALHSAMKRELVILALVVFSIMVCLYGVLLVVGRRADHTIKEQHRKITSQLAELDEAHRLLELRVEERTTELSATYAELQQQSSKREQAERATADRIRADLHAQRVLASMLQAAMEPISFTLKIERILEMLIKGHVLEGAISAAVYMTQKSSKGVALLAFTAPPGAQTFYPEWLALDEELIQESLLFSKILFCEIDQPSLVPCSASEASQYWMPILARKDSNQGILIIEVQQRQSNEYNIEAFLQMVSHTLAGVVEAEQSDALIKRLSHAVEQSHASIIMTDRNGKIEYVNRQFSLLTGYSDSEAKGQTPALIKSDQTPPEVYQELWGTLLKGEQWCGELLNQKKNGELFWESENISPIKNEQGEITHFIAVKEDITDRKNTELQLVQLATHDGLTTLPNRSLLKDRLEMALALSRRKSSGGALLFIDLDDFKLVNDHYGHSAGDQLLKEVSQRLLEAIRETDTVGRHGGDEFVVVLSDLSSTQDILAIVDKIFGALQKSFKIAQRSLDVHCSMGISRFPADAGDVETLFRQADIAMYKAKEQGRNQYCLYEAEMGALICEKASMLNDLRRAINAYELVLHYQPKIDLKTGQIRSTEALIRWQHPEQGMITPRKFIHLAEESGLIIPIGQWVLDTACRQQKAWLDAGLPLESIAVNLSARQLQEVDLYRMVKKALLVSGLPANFLELEITESMMMHDPEAVIKTLYKLRALGVKFAIDDFGTGYSSLAYIKRFPISRVKVDQLFIHNLEQDSVDSAIVDSIITMSHNLQCKVIAEGVETQQQLAHLHKLGCDEIQGFYFSRALPAARLAQLVSSQRRINMANYLIEEQSTNAVRPAELG